MFAMTACHPTLPFGSIVRVVNTKNKRSVVVRITDRGDLIDENRIIDLSYAAADKLKMTRNGLASVSLQVISLGRMKYQNEKASLGKQTPKRPSRKRGGRFALGQIPDRRDAPAMLRAGGKLIPVSEKT